ncbi:hypothetical protein ACQ4PT_010339 [Festuca glaucescens]
MPPAPPDGVAPRVRARLAPADCLCSLFAGRSPLQTEPRQHVAQLPLYQSDVACSQMHRCHLRLRISCCWVVVEAETGLPNHSGLKTLWRGAAQDSSPAAARLEARSWGDGEELLFVSSKFGSNGNLEHHGFARNRLWTIDDNPPPLPVNPSIKAFVDIILKPTEDDLKMWPHSFEFRLRIALDALGDLSLTSRIRNTNTDGRPFSYTFAYHTYFAVSDIRAIVHAYQMQVKTEERSTITPPLAKKTKKQSAIGAPPGFPPLEGSTVKQQAIRPTTGGKKNKATQELEEDRPGTVKRGRRTLVGCLREANFRHHFMRKVTVNPYGPLKVLKAFCKLITGDFRRKIVLSNAVGDAWRARLVEWRRRVFIEHGWDEFTEATTSKKVIPCSLLTLWVLQ